MSSLETRRPPVITIATVLSALVVSSALYVSIQGPTGSESLLVYAPPALYSLVLEYAELHEETYGVKVYISTGSTGSLLGRIEITRSGDVLFTADHVFMERAISRGLVDEDTVRVVSYLVPAIVVRRGNPHNITGIRDLAAKPLRVGVADPENAPFGRIALELLKRAGVYDSVRDRLVVSSDVGQVARQLVLGLVDATILPYTVKYWYPSEVDVVWLRPEEVRGFVTCQLATVVVYTASRERARLFIESFIEWLRENASKRGYIVDPEDFRYLTPYNPLDLDLPEVCLSR